MNIEPGLSPSIVDIVVAMSNKIRERLDAQAFEVKLHKRLPLIYLRMNQCL